MLMAESGVPTDKNSRDLNILLIGKSGNGVTSVANTIYWKNKTSTTLSSDGINSFHGVIGTQHFMDRKLKVVDTPGIVETKTKSARTGLIKKITTAVEICPNGYNAFLLVLKYGNRLSEEDKTIFRFIKSIFGEHVYTNHIILIMTYGDNFNSQKESMKVANFDEWAIKQTGIFETLLLDCSKRIILFDNYNTDVQNRKILTDKLIALVDSLKSDPYTTKDFQKASLSRQSIVKELKIPRLREKLLISKERLLSDHAKAKRIGNDKMILELEIILCLAKALLEKINQKLKDTDIQLDETNSIKEFIIKVDQDLHKQQEIKQKEIDIDKCLQKAEREKAETELTQLKEELQRIKMNAFKFEESNKSLQEENRKTKLIEEKAKQDLRLQLTKKDEEIEKLNQKLKMQIEQYEHQANKIDEARKQIIDESRKREELERKFKKAEIDNCLQLNEKNEEIKTYQQTLKNEKERFEKQSIKIKETERKIVDENMKTKELEAKAKKNDEDLHRQLKQKDDELKSLENQIRDAKNICLEEKQKRKEAEQKANKNEQYISERSQLLVDKDQLSREVDLLKKQNLTLTEQSKNAEKQFSEQIKRQEAEKEDNVKQLKKDIDYLSKEVNFLKEKLPILTKEQSKTEENTFSEEINSRKEETEKDEINDMKNLEERLKSAQRKLEKQQSELKEYDYTTTTTSKKKKK